jgi:hypothetical protein
LTFEGSFSQRSPNTGTRGFGDHHTSHGVYFAWGRHPEQGKNCGFCTDNVWCHPDPAIRTNGYLWVK